MRFLQRFNDEVQRTAQPVDDGGSDALLQQSRSDGDRLLAAGDEAIRRALSDVDSEAFLRASRQQGGE